MTADKFRNKFDKDLKREALAKGSNRRDAPAEENVQIQEDKAPAKPVSTTEFIEKVLTINRVTKVTKGGKKLSFSALVVVGNGKGRVGYSIGKAREVAIAIRKALLRAKKDMISVPMRGTTITHEVLGHCGAALVMLKPASEGTGVIAAGPVRAICDGAGIRNILTKCHKSNNPINVVKATMDGLSRLKSVNSVGVASQQASGPATVKEFNNAAA